MPDNQKKKIKKNGSIWIENSQVKKDKDNKLKILIISNP